MLWPLRRPVVDSTGNDDCQRVGVERVGAANNTPSADWLQLNLHSVFPVPVPAPSWLFRNSILARRIMNPLSYITRMFVGKGSSSRQSPLDRLEQLRRLYRHRAPRLRKLNEEAAGRRLSQQFAAAVEAADGKRENSRE